MALTLPVWRQLYTLVNYLRDECFYITSWSGADWSGVVSLMLYGLMWTDLVWYQLHYKVWCGLFQSGLRW